jgi:hypothetical protein
MRRNFILLSLACGATFLGVIFVGENGARTGVETQVSMPVPPGTLASASRAPAVSMAFPNQYPLHLVSASVPTDDYPFNENSAATLSDVQQLAADVSVAADPDARAMLIRQLDGAATPESLNVLEKTLRDDDVARNRLLAVNSLRLIAKRGDDGGRILAVLRLAMTDADPNVATSASDAYREIER